FRQGQNILYFISKTYRIPTTRRNPDFQYIIFQPLPPPSYLKFLIIFASGNSAFRNPQFAETQ
ncbi:MAG: hypothetical protein NC124_16455, partial [Clostridium sp.]|nr:hypothetical protein [Clostridium sp.]